MIARVRRALRSAWCVAMNGRHAMFVARRLGWIGQRCAWCGRETSGWHVPTRKVA